MTSRAVYMKEYRLRNKDKFREIERLRRQKRKALKDPKSSLIEVVKLKEKTFRCMAYPCSSRETMEKDVNGCKAWFCAKHFTGS